MSTGPNRSSAAKSGTPRKPRLSKFDQALAEAVNEATLDAVNFHHAAGRSVWGATDNKLSELAPPTTELIR